MELNTKLQLVMDTPGREENSDESKSVMIKDMIQQFIMKSIQSKANRDEIKSSLTKIYDTDLLLGKEIYEWALERTASLLPEVSSNESPDSPEEEKESAKPLFCEDIVYHASLCCYAISTKDTLSYKKFFDDSKHHFDELSLSRDPEDVDRYIIARKGTTFFFVFLSEPSFSKWPKCYNSFEQG